MKREPVAIANAILAAIVALVGLLSTLDIWTPTGAQLGALSSFYVAAAALVIFLVRGQTYSPESVQQISDAVQLVRVAPDAELAEEADQALARLLPPPQV